MKTIIVLVLASLLSSCWTPDNTNQAIKSSERIVNTKQLTDSVDKVSDNITKRVKEKQKTAQKIVAKNTNKVEIAKSVLTSISDEKLKVKASIELAKINRDLEIEREKTKQIQANASRQQGWAEGVSITFVLVALFSFFGRQANRFKGRFE